MKYSDFHHERTLRSILWTTSFQEDPGLTRRATQEDGSSSPSNMHPEILLSEDARKAAEATLQHLNLDCEVASVHKQKLREWLPSSSTQLDAVAAAIHSHLLVDDGETSAFDERNPDTLTAPLASASSATAGVTQRQVEFTMSQPEQRTPRNSQSCAQPLSPSLSPSHAPSQVNCMFHRNRHAYPRACAVAEASEQSTMSADCSSDQNELLQSDISFFCQRVLETLNLEPECLVIALVLLERVEFAARCALSSAHARISSPLDIALADTLPADAAARFDSAHMALGDSERIAAGGEDLVRGHDPPLWNRA